MSKKVLVLNMDMIMRHFIPMYFQFIDENDPMEALSCWENLMPTEIQSMLQYDAKVLMSYAHLIKKHESVDFKTYRTCKEMAIDFEKYEETFDLTNVGFFSGTGKSSNDFVDAVDFLKVNDFNWEAYLKKIGRIEKYSWIRSPNSFPAFNAKDTIDTIIPLRALDDIDEKFDSIIIIRSDYIPYKFNHLVDLLCLIPSNSVKSSCSKHCKVCVKCEENKSGSDSEV